MAAGQAGQIRRRRSFRRPNFETTGRVGSTTKEDANDILARALGDGKHEFGSFFLSRFFGMAVSYEGEYCSVAFNVDPFFYNPQGSLHGGVLATALDISMGHLLKQHFGAGATLEMKVQYFAPAREGAVICQASFLKKGRKIFFLQSWARDSAGETLAHATSTWKRL